MVNATLEIAEKKIQFSGLEELRSELRKQAGNPEYLAAFETTIDKALKESDRDGIIEFTEKEWQQLITNENLPPIEKVKKLLADKISAMKEVTAETKEQTGGLAEEFTKKIDEVKKWVTEKVDKTKKEITAGITEALSPIQKIKDSFVAMGTKIGDFFSEIGNTFKFLLFTLGAALGLKSAKDALATMAKEKAEKVIAEWKEKAGGKVAEVKEEWEKIAEWKWNIFDSLSRTLLGSAAVTWLMQALPASVRDKLGAPSDGKNFLLRCAGNRFLQMCGVSGLLLAGLWGVAKVSEDPEIIAKIGAMPNEPEAQKTWIRKALEYCGDIGREAKDAVTGALSSGWDIANGSKLSEYLESKKEEAPEGMVTLAEKLSPTAGYIDDLEFDIEKYGKQALPILILLSVFNKRLISFWLSWAFTGIKWATAILGMVGHNLITTAMIFAAVTNGAVLAGHKIYVPEDNEKLADWFKDIVELPEIRAEFEKQWIPTDALDSARDNIGEFVDVLSDEEALENRLDAEKKRVIDKMEEAGIKFMAPEKKDVISKTNKEWFDWLQKNLKRHVKNPSEQEIEFIKIVGEIAGKWEITKENIATLISASQGTNIRIHDKWNGYIRWSINDEMGVTKASDFLCASPLLDDNDKYHKSRKMPLNSDGKLWLMGSIPWAFLWGLQNAMTELREAVEKNDTKKWGSILEKLMGNQWEVAIWGGNVVWEWLTLPLDFWNNAIKTFSWKMTAQEMLVETTDGLAPIIVMCSGVATWNTLVNKLTDGKWGKKMGIIDVLLSSASYATGKGQIKIWKGIYHMFAHSSDTLQTFTELLGDKKITIESGFYEFIDRKRSLWYRLGGMKELSKIFRELAEIKKVQKNLELAKRARGRKDIAGMDKFIAEARSAAWDILRDNRKKYGITTHALDRILLLNASNLDTTVSELQTDISNLFARRNTLQTVTSANVRTLAQNALNTPISSPQRSRLRKAWGLVWLIALLATPVVAGVVAENKNNKESANDEIDDLGESYEAVDYGGFAGYIPASEKIGNNSPEMRGIFSKIDEIKDTLIGEDNIDTTKQLLENNLNFYQSSDEKTMKGILSEVQPRYEASINRFRKLCEQNKPALEKYFLDNPEKQKEEIKVCAFLGVTWNEGKLAMRYMSREKFERHFYSTFDHVQNNLWNYEDDGRQSGWEKTGEVGKNITPVWSSWIDTKQTWKDFSRGHIKSWLINGSMAALWWTSDALLAAGIITSPTVVWALWFGGAAAGLRWLNVFIKGSKVVRWIKKAEVALETAQQTAQWMYLAVEKDQIEYL